MAELVPYPFESLVSRMVQELERGESVFGLPRRRFFTGSDNLDFSVRLHGRTAGTPLGPAAGPHTQMAQNLVLGWLAGARIFELKTVQVRDDLVIPRPCIDMRTVGYNAEWSQELTVDRSLAEYVKGAMLIAILRDSGSLPMPPRATQTIFDMSVGYDLPGIRSEKVGRFLDGMSDASTLVEALRRQIPPAQAKFRDLDFPSRISDTVTLSTFHGCPPDQIEKIALYLMRERNLHCVVKFNPTLLGAAEVRHLLHEILGYTHIRVPATAFEHDTTWPQAVDMVGRLETAAAGCGRSFGVKFSNTLLVENTTEFLPESQREVYLSGAPLHVLAMHLVARFREHFDDRIPISFSAGIDASNYPSAVALGLVPVTVCTDLLRPGGYGRLAAYHQKLAQEMTAAGVSTIPEWVRRGSAEAALETYVRKVTSDPRYAAARNATPPPRVDRCLALFDCITCDKCIPVCPNDANFTFITGHARIPQITVSGQPGAALFERGEDLVLEHPHQIGCFADFCNECGNCDVFCPEEGGPYAIKPLFFGSEHDWEVSTSRDGFFITPSAVFARMDGATYHLTMDGTLGRFSGSGFDVTLDLEDPEKTLRGSWSEPVPLTRAYVMDLVRRSVLDPRELNYLNVAWSDPSLRAPVLTGDDSRPEKR